MQTDWRLIVLLFVAGLFAAAQFAKIALTLDPLEVVYPGVPIPLAVSALSVAGILFGVTAGMIVARFGARRVLLTAITLAAVLSVLQSMLPGFAVFMGLRVLEGFSHLAIVVAAPTLMAAAASPRDKPVAMGLWGTFFGVGFAGAAVVISLLETPRAVYLAHAGGLVVLGAALWPLLPRGVARATPESGFLARHLAIYRSPRLVAPAVGFLWHTIMFLGLLTFLPKFLGTWTAPLLPLVALVGTMGAGVLARWITPRIILLVAFAVSVAGFVVVMLVPDEAQVFVIIPLFLILGLVPGASFANVPALNPEPADQARANGAIAQLGNIGTATSTPLMAATMPFGLAGPIMAATVICAVGLGLVWLIHRNINEIP